MKKKYLLPILFFTVLIPNFLAAQIQFSPYLAIPTGSHPDVVSIGDVNNDGLKDVVLTTSQYFDPVNDYKVFVFTQNTQGDLNTPILYSYPLGGSGDIKTIDIADMNQDGLNDVIVGYATMIGIYFQNNSGTLDSIVTTSVGSQILCMKSGDLNNDGLTDLAVNVDGNLLKVLVQQNNGPFLMTSYANTTYWYASELHIADLNADGKNDVVSMSGSDGINVFTQNPAGTLNAFVFYTANNTSLAGIAVGDLNNDGNIDVAGSIAANSPAAKIAIWYQDPGTHLIQAPVHLSAYDIPEPIEIADLNNDNKNEIVAAHGGWMKLSCYQQNSIGVFNSYTAYSIPYASHYNRQGMCIGDINNDGMKDVAIADYNSGLVILYNTSTLGLQTVHAQQIQIYPNPASDVITVDVSKIRLDSNTRIQLHNALGAIVMELPLTDNDHVELNVESLPAGFYILKIGSGASSIAQKIIKK